MDTPILLDRNGLLAAWHRLVATAQHAVRDRYELNGFGEVVANGCPSGTRQLAFTDIYCQLADQMGHLAAMSVPVVTPSFGIRVPDVVWMAPEKWEGLDGDTPVPFVPDLCVEVLLDSDRTLDLDRRVTSYLEGGAREVIVVGQRGQIEIWGPEGLRQASMLGVALPLDRMYFEESDVAAALSARC
ncbi:Uma2 family endonuclease [Paraburkholderia sp. BL10I2N1]|uniref:Uma2 family endonuclease n=1 Tax=Paraburkholderia sp. BL10I2N1 TaxID=1938796 RepID=UPI00105F6F41|nr:Uma2 family endonuclease [Paraburkholderia sp. BL10I2N1]TDN68837.1 putative restriction endonuclease [Paraburkholderia sp. BL10I2N1]